MIHNISRFITALALLATAQGAWAQSSFSGGNGTQADPYKISSSADLVQLATDINNSTSRLYEDQYFVQTGNINMSGINFVPIGINDDNNHRFRSNYNGQNYTISNLTVNGSYEYTGLFGYIYNAEIDNVRLVSPSITTTNSRASYTGALVGFANMPGIHHCVVINPTLSGGNSIGVFAGGQSAGNIKYTYYTGNNNYSNVGNTIGSNANTSIGHAYALTLSGGATTSNAAAFTYNSTDYYLSGTINLAAAPAGWIYAYTVNGSPIDGTSFTISADAIVALSRTPDPTHFSDNGDGSYTIKTADGWNVFCDLLAENTFGYFTGKTVRLGADITATRMAGGENHEFTGTFDGDGKTLTVNYTNNSNDVRTAPFSYVNGATIQNLIVGGTISGTAYRAAGIVGETTGQTTITNCVSSVDISSGRYTGGISIGGLVTITGCVFNGKIVGTTYSGGFVGYSNTATAISNSLFAPQDGSSISGGTFYYNGGGDITPTNSYYTSALGTPQGKATRTVAAADVTIAAVALTGTATQYTVSGITAYSGGGLQRGQTLYYGSGDQLRLTLSNSATGAPQGYQYGYTASAGTLSGTTLTMPDEDVTISVNTAALAPIDWATVNQGDSEEDPYMIYNKDQLLLLAHRVNGTCGETANTYEGKYFKLGADITFSHAADEPDNYAENYEAIGGYYNSTTRYFNGMFDGDGHTVSGIRIRKTGSGNADINQGLFDCIASSADIHDVHLTDARITGYNSVGGIAGYNNGGIIRGCSVTDSYITANSNSNYGTICGSTSHTSHLTNNYYHGCTVNGTAATSGVGYYGSDITANNGALPAYRLALGANITTPPGTFVGQTEWLDTPPVDARLAPENGFTLAGNHYFASGYEFTPGSTLASGAAQGYTPRATLGGQLLDPYTPTGDADPLDGKAIARLTITADCDGKTLNAAIRSDGLQHEVSYMTADGTTQTAQAVALDGTETNLAAGWYFVGKNISYNATLTLGGDVHLILADGKTMKVRTTKKGDGIFADGHSLHIYGQTEGTGALNAQTNDKFDVVIRITNGTLGIHGGNVNATVESTVSVRSAIRVVRATAGDALVIDRGTLTANSKSSCGIYIEGGDVRINGGQVTATGEQLGIDISDYVDEDDESLSIPGILTLSGGTLTASSFDTWSGESYAGTLAVASGHTYTDGTGLYDSTTETATLAALGGKTLQPCLALADAADNTAAITAHAGKTLAVALSGRTLYKDGSWNTLCLPFDISTASGTLSGDNVQAMTLNTTTSNLADGTLTLNFTATETIPAGTPFIIKWDNTGVNIEDPVFEDVTVSNTTNNATIEGVLTFTGTYAPVSIPAAGDNTKLYLGAANKLYYPNAAMTIGTHRAYFQLADGITAGNSAGGNEHGDDVEDLVRAFVLNFDDDEATGIITTNFTNSTNSSNEWYTLDGVKLAAKPTAKGLYIHGGKKVAIK